MAVCLLPLAAEQAQLAAAQVVPVAWLPAAPPVFLLLQGAPVRSALRASSRLAAPQAVLAWVAQAEAAQPDEAQLLALPTVC